MSRLLVIILVLLIPLRGWSAERMAFQMAYSQAVAAVAGEQVSMSDMPADCPMLVQTESKAEKSSSEFKGPAACQTCQLCMTLASSSFPQTQLAACITVVQPESASTSFISANVAPQIRPPIL
jgi:hypothetical protein